MMEVDRKRIKKGLFEAKARVILFGIENTDFRQ